MLFKNVTEETLTTAINIIAAQSCPSLHFENFKKAGKGFRGVLRCKSDESHARTGPSGRRTTSANWHLHLWFFEEIFKAEPKAIIITALEKYNGKEEFERKAKGTYYKQVGSVLSPIMFGEL